jgi:HEAT repeat protein
MIAPKHGRIALALALLAAPGPPAARAEGWLAPFVELRPAPAELGDPRLPLAQRVALARAFGAFGPEQDVVPVLLAALAQADTPPLLRDEILLSLARRAPSQADAPLSAQLAARPDVEPALCMALAAIATPRALQALVGALGRKEGAAIAARALARVGERAVPQLAAALAGPSALRAAQVLGEIGEPALARGSGALVRALAAQRPELRAAAARALGRIGAGAAAPLLLRLLRDGSPEVAHAALGALALLATPAQGAVLAAHLARSPPPERPLALRALAAADPGRALSALQRALAGDEPALRAAALQVLEDERPNARFLPLLAALFAREQREATASALARLPEGRGLPALLAVGRRSPESAEPAARAIALVLRHFGDDLPGEQVEQAHALLHSLPPARRLQLSALARDPDALDAIRTGLTARRAGERAAAASAAALLGDGELAGPLISALVRERDLEAARSQAQAALQLGVRAPRAAWQRLLSLGELAPEAMQLAAAGADRHAADDGIAPALRGGATVDGLRVFLRRTLASRRPARVRAASALALGALGDQPAVSALRAALADPSTRVRLAAVRALGALGGVESAHACAAHARVERDARVRRAAQDVAARDGRALAIAERGELVLEARVIGVDEAGGERPLVDVLLDDGRWLRVRAGSAGELIVADLPAGTAELRRVE